MSASTEVFREFLVLLGWQTDEKAMRKSLAAVEDFGKKLLALSAAAEAASLTVVGSLGKMARSFEDAYYASSRTESSVREMKRFEYVASQIGSSADEARGAVEGLKRKMRDNIGFADWLKNLGVANVNDGTKAVQELLAVLAKMPINQAEAIAGIAGIPEHLLLAYRRGFTDIDKFTQDYDAKQKAFGLNLEKAAEDGRDLARSFRSLGETLSLLKDKVGSDLFQKLQPGLDKLGKFVEEHADKLSRVLTDIANALLNMFTYVVEHLEDIDKFAKRMGGWEPVLTVIAVLLAGSALGIVPNMARLFTSMLAITGLVIPTWLLALLGIAGLGAYGVYETYQDHGKSDPDILGQGFQAEGGAAFGGGGSDTPVAPAAPKSGDERNWWQRTMPKILGGQDAPAQAPAGGYGAKDVPELKTSNLFGRKPDLADVDPRLRTILAAAQTHLPPGYRVEVTEGYNANGHAPHSQHHIKGRGAVDLHIVGPDGKVIANRGEDPSGIYHRLARAAYGEMLARYPELKGKFAWGGQFGTVPGGGTSDLMHYDLGGERGHIQENAPSRMGPLPASPGSAAASSVNNFDAASWSQSFQTPLGDFGRRGGSVSHSPTTTINVTGTPDPDGTPGQVGSPTKRDHTQLMQNLQSAVG